MPKSPLDALRDLKDQFSDACETHIYAPEDDHPADCGYCGTIAAAEATIKAAEEALTSQADVRIILQAIAEGSEADENDEGEPYDPEAQKVWLASVAGMARMAALIMEARAGVARPVANALRDLLDRMDAGDMDPKLDPAKEALEAYDVETKAIAEGRDPARGRFEETLAEIAYLAGNKWFTGSADNRADMQTIIGWAHEFEASRRIDDAGNETYFGKEYLSAVEDFTARKVKGATGENV